VQGWIWLYTVYSKNRKDGYGGVLIAIFNEYITSQVTELDTNCEIVWATIKSTIIHRWKRFNSLYERWI
jgi:hypothetical protein